MYRLYFPLMALARYKRALAGERRDEAVHYDWPMAVAK